MKRSWRHGDIASAKFIKVNMYVDKRDIFFLPLLLHPCLF
jgi:hypothetical protein